MEGKWQYPASPLESAAPVVGDGFAASYAAAVAGRGGAEDRALGAFTYDPACYLCPGNKRAGGAVNPHV